MTNAWRRGVSTLLWLGLSTASLVAQTSEVAGRIEDASKGAVSGAKVTLIRTETGDHRAALSSAEGYYRFPLLVPGTYQIRVEKDSFQSQTRTGIKVETGDITTVDLQLQVGTVAQSVTVNESAPLLETGTSAISQIVENESITEFPLLDRRSSQLTRLSGFVVQAGAGASATFAIAGGRGNNSNYMIDGGNVQNLNLGVPTLVFDPPVESMQEFNVAISNYAAELGRTGGGVVQMTTKSGTNNFHGSAYEFFRNDALNTRTFFGAATKPILRYNCVLARRELLN